MFIQGHILICFGCEDLFINMISCLGMIRDHGEIETNLSGDLPFVYFVAFKSGA